MPVSELSFAAPIGAHLQRRPGQNISAGHRREAIGALDRLLATEAARRPGDSARLVASPKKIISELGWKPEHTNMQEILSSAWKWHTSHPNGYDT